MGCHWRDGGGPGWVFSTRMCKFQIGPVGVVQRRKDVPKCIKVWTTSPFNLLYIYFYYHWPCMETMPYPQQALTPVTPVSLFVFIFLTSEGIWGVYGKFNVIHTKTCSTVLLQYSHTHIQTSHLCHQTEYWFLSLLREGVNGKYNSFEPQLKDILQTGLDLVFVSKKITIRILTAYSTCMTWDFVLARLE